MPTTTPGGATVPVGGDTNNVPADFVTYDASKYPRLTTAQIAAKSWVDKPAGWLAFDTTLQKVVRSTGAAMVPMLDGAADGVWKPWSVTLGAMTTAPTYTATADACRYVVVGGVVLARATLTVTAGGSGMLYVIFPVAAKSASSAQRVGSLLRLTPNALSSDLPLIFPAGGGSAMTETSANSAALLQVGDRVMVSLEYEAQT